MNRILIILSFLLPCSLVAQDIQLSQFYEADLLLNPALSGSTHRSRAMAHSRVQWYGVGGSYVSNFISFDTYSSKYKSGFSGFITHDEQGKGIIKTTQLSLAYSYQMVINGSWSLRFGLQGGYFTKSISDNGLIYPDQVTPGGITPPTGGFGTVSFGAPDLSAGGVLYNRNLWFGFSSHHINRPTQSFSQVDIKYPVKYSLIMGYKIDLKRKRPTSRTSQNDELNLFPIFHYKFQGKSDQIETGLIFIDNMFKAGVIYRGIPTKKYNSSLHNNEAFIFLLGLRMKHFKITYSYDAVVSKLSQSGPSGAHELNISYIFHQGKKPFKPSRKLPCPDFK